VILKWYKDGHVAKGWTVYGEQMKKFIEWLEHAESGTRIIIAHAPFFIIDLDISDFQRFWTGSD